MCSAGGGAASSGNRASTRLTSSSPTQDAPGAHGLGDLQRPFGGQVMRIELEARSGGGVPDAAAASSTRSVSDSRSAWSAVSTSRSACLISVTPGSGSRAASWSACRRAVRRRRTGHRRRGAASSPACAVSATRTLRPAPPAATAPGILQCSSVSTAARTQTRRHAPLGRVARARSRGGPAGRRRAGATPGSGRARPRIVQHVVADAARAGTDFFQRAAQPLQAGGGVATAEAGGRGDLLRVGPRATAGAPSRAA